MVFSPQTIRSGLHGSPRLSSLGENAAAGQECPAYRIFEIAAFIRAPKAGHSAVSSAAFS